MRSFASYGSKGFVLIAAGALLGIALVIFGILRLGSSGNAPAAPAVAAQRVSQLVTAARPIGRGQLIRPGDLKTTSVLGRPPAQSILSPADAVGKVAVTDIQSQQLILSSLISADPAAAGLAMLVPVGQRVISVDTTDEIAVGGFLRPGDAVDVEIVLPAEVFGSGVEGADRSESRTLLQNIKVVTVGPTLGGQEERQGRDKPEPSRTLTLALAPDQVGLLTLARKMGRFYLVLRNPNDSAVIPTPRTVLARLRGGEAAPRPAMVARPFSAAPRPAPARPVELIVGGQRQILYPGSAQ